MKINRIIFFLMNFLIKFNKIINYPPFFYLNIKYKLYLTLLLKLSKNHRPQTYDYI